MATWPRQWNADVPLGYQRAANVVVNYDGGNHSLYGRLLNCDTCGTAVLESNVAVHDKWHAELKKQLFQLTHDVY
jgi:hypothetical protein